MLLTKARDHPRVCGENIQKALVDYVELGSPPRVRGKRDTQHARASPDRITPACAGKTSFIMHRRCRYQDHPRVCGENMM